MLDAVRAPRVTRRRRTCVRWAGVHGGPGVAAAKGPTRTPRDGSVQGPVPGKRGMISVPPVRQWPCVAEPNEVDHPGAHFHVPHAFGVRPAVFHSPSPPARAHRLRTSCSLPFPDPSSCYSRTGVQIHPTTGKAMARTPSNRIDEGSLTKGQLRKLTALRKSIGSEIGERAFAEWLSSQPAGKEDGENGQERGTDRRRPLAPGPARQAGDPAECGYPKAWTGGKTGYTRASGYNIASSAARDGKRLIAVVFGGKSARWRDRHVARLLDRGFAALRRGGHGADRPRLEGPRGASAQSQADPASGRDEHAMVDRGRPLPPVRARSSGDHQGARCCAVPGQHAGRHSEQRGRRRSGRLPAPDHGAQRGGRAPLLRCAATPRFQLHPAAGPRRIHRAGQPLAA